MRRLVIVAALGLGGCSGTTGSQLIGFAAVAQGNSAAADFDNSLGQHVTLSSASLHVAAVYLNLAKATSGGGETACVLPGVYGGQVFGPLDIDLLSDTPAPFATPGAGTEGDMYEAEVWISGGDINAPTDDTVIFSAAGTVDDGAGATPFSASVTISANRARPPLNVAEPDSRPICEERIVGPISFYDGSDMRVPLALSDGGTLALQVDARRIFAAVDFRDLPAGGVIPDDFGGIGGELFSGLKGAAPYAFSFTAKP